MEVVAYISVPNIGSCNWCSYVLMSPALTFIRVIVSIPVEEVRKGCVNDKVDGTDTAVLSFLSFHLDVVLRAKLNIGKNYIILHH